MGWNLPPGCRESDIPGNRPKDIAFDKFLDNFEAELEGLTEEQIEAKFEAWYEAQDRED